MNPNELIPYDKNARTHSSEQIAQIAVSIKEFGFTNPILIDGQNNVIAGHGRLAAAKLLGLQDVPTITLPNLTDAQKRAYIIADNKLAMNAGWDMDVLKAEVERLVGESFDISKIGFSAEELDAMLAVEVVPQSDEDDVPEVVEPKTRLGDLYQLGEHRLLCGDSTSIDAVERLMNGEKADMVFTDPPYGVDYEGINNDSRDGLEDLLNAAFANYSIVSKPGAPIYLFHSDRCADIFHSVFRKFCHFSSMIVWNKNALVLSQTDYQSKHEPCFYGWFLHGTHKFYGDRSQTSIWDFHKEKVEGHTTPKPVALIERAISNSSKIMQSVLDLFGGSGSTLIACEKTNRKCFMMELDPHYCDVIVARWEKYTGKTAVLLSNS